MWAPYSQKVIPISIDLEDPSLVGAWMMDPVDNTLVDLTVSGNDGVITLSTVEQTILGPMRRYLPNSGSNGTLMGGANAFPLEDLTLVCWYRAEDIVTPNYLFGYYKNAVDSWAVKVTATIRIYDDIDDAGTFLYATPVVHNTLTQVIVVMNSLENLLYINGELAGSGISSLDNWASFTGTLWHGSTATGAGSLFEGIASPMCVYNEAKDQQWVTEQYLKSAKAVPFKTDWGVTVSVGIETSGWVGNDESPFEIISGSHRINTDIIDGETVKVIECVDQDDGAVAVPTSVFFETPTESAFGTWDFWGYQGSSNNNWNFMPIASNPIAWDDASQDGYLVQISGTERLALYRITGGASAATLINAGIDYVANYTWYHLRLTRDYAGVFVLYIRGGVFTEWTIVGTSASDLTHTISSYNVIDNDNTDKFAYSDNNGNHCFNKYLGVIPPSEAS